jgi:hypothetical protein
MRASQHRRGAAAAGDELVPLVAGTVLEHDDALVRPRAGWPGRDDLGLRADGVPGEGDLVEAEVRHGRAECRLERRQPDQERQREQAVDEPAPEFGRGRERLVEMQGLRVHREHREQRVVGLGDGARHGMVDDQAWIQIFEPAARCRPGWGTTPSNG